MSTPSQPPIACCAKEMPLARTINEWAWLTEAIAQAGGFSYVEWGLTRSEDVSKIESDCGLEKSVYLFAGFVQPGIGRPAKGRKVFPKMAFAYKPEVEKARSGFANPFDTGGVWRGKTPSLAGKKESEEARKLIEETKRPLDGWRRDFDDYLKAYFQDGCEAYMAGEPPDMVSSPTWGPDNLPARHPANQTDRHSWSWEVRIEEPFPIFGHLIAWSCTEDTRSRFFNELCKPDCPPPPPDRKLFYSQCIVDDFFSDASSTLSKEMIDWVKEQCRANP